MNKRETELGAEAEVEVDRERQGEKTKEQAKPESDNEEDKRGTERDAQIACRTDACNIGALLTTCVYYFGGSL